LKVEVSGEFVGDELRGEQFGYNEDFMVWDSNEESQGVENVPNHQLKGKLVDPKASPNPGEKSVDARGESSAMRLSGTLVNLRGDQR